MSEKVPVSVIIPVKNEEANLDRCLEALRWADEIFVVDSKSTDRTGVIAESYGAQVVQFEFGGVWPKKKNWALENIPFRNEWVLIVDADEVMPPESAEEIRSAISNCGNIAGYVINRRFYFMDKRLNHAYFPNWNLRLFKHRLGRYEQLTDKATSSGDNEVHEHVGIDGPIGKLNLIMDHYAFPTIDTFIEKHNRYSNWEAQVMLDQSMGTGIEAELGKDIGTLRRLKRIFWRLPGKPFIRFGYVYFWQKGFLDGIEGFYFSCLHAVYQFLIDAKLQELKKRRRK